MKFYIVKWGFKKVVLLKIKSGGENCKCDTSCKSYLYRYHVDFLEYIRYSICYVSIMNYYKFKLKYIHQNANKNGRGVLWVKIL